MANGLPTKAKVGIPGRTVDIDTDTYFLAKRMERAGMLQRGQALCLAATVRQPTAKPSKDRPPKRGKK